MKKFAFALMWLHVCLAQQSQLNFGGSVSGTLTGDDGTIISGAYVTLLLVPPYPSGRLDNTEWAVVSDANGAFRFDGLNDGVYQVCAQVPQSAWLNPCAWGPATQPISLSVAQPTASLMLVMAKGAVVPIRVDDPLQLLAQNEGITREAHLLLGIGHDPFLFEPALVASSDLRGRNYQTVVPFNYPAKLVVYSSFFRLSNAAGAALPSTAVSIPFTVRTGQQPPTLRFVLTGGGSQ